MRYLGKKINLYSIAKSYFSVFLMLILYTFGYYAINHPAVAEEFVSSIMSFSPEIKILFITGTLLLFLILIYEKLCNQESSSQNSSSSIKGNSSTASDVPLSTLAAGTELPDYDIINSSALMDSQPVSTSLVNNSVLSITPLEIDFNHLQEWKFYGQEDKFSILKQIIPVTIKAILCSFIGGIAILSCGFVIDALIKGQQFLPTILEFVSGMSNLLGISNSTLLAVAFVPMVALTIFSILSKPATHAQDNTGRVLEKSTSIEVERVRVRNKSVGKDVGLMIIDKTSHKNRYYNDWRHNSTNPFSENYHSQQKQNSYHGGTNQFGSSKANNTDWRKDLTNPFSENYNCTNLTIERFLREPEKALG